jgi:hypothetical protein
VAVEVEPSKLLKREKKTKAKRKKKTSRREGKYSISTPSEQPHEAVENLKSRGRASPPQLGGAKLKKKKKKKVLEGSKLEKITKFEVKF